MGGSAMILNFASDSSFEVSRGLLQGSYSRSAQMYQMQHADHPTPLSPVSRSDLPGVDVSTTSTAAFEAQNSQSYG